MLSTVADSASVYTATAAMTGIVTPVPAAAAMDEATVSTVAWFSTATAAPARCFCSSRNGRRSRGGAAGVSGTAAARPTVAASAASRGPSRSKTWVTSGLTS